MKQIFLTGSILAFFTIAGKAMGQDENISGLPEKETLTLQKKDIKREERDVRKEERQRKKEEVSYFTKEQFDMDFPDAENTHFYMGKYFEEVFFSRQDKAYTAFYDNNNRLAGTTMVTQFDELPANAQKMIGKKYNNYTVNQVILFDDNEMNDTDMWMYETSFADEDTWFVELQKDTKRIALQVNKDGMVSFFRELSK